jgi:hypothetical protein
LTAGFLFIFGGLSMIGGVATGGSALTAAYFFQSKKK